MINESKPDFINKEGTSWWFQEDLTKYARKDLSESCRGIPEAQVWICETKSKYRSYVVVLENKIINENQTLEGIACYVDFLKLSRKK